MRENLCFRPKSSGGRVFNRNEHKDRASAAGGGEAALFGDSIVAAHSGSIEDVMTVSRIAWQDPQVFTRAGLCIPYRCQPVRVQCWQGFGDHASVREGVSGRQGVKQVESYEYRVLTRV